MDEPKKPKQREWIEPEVKDYGDLRELTASSTNQAVTDVPIGFPVQTTTPP